MNDISAIDVIDGYAVSCSPGGTLWVNGPGLTPISVLPKGTHAALNPLGVNTKRKIVRWWKEQR